MRPYQTHTTHGSESLVTSAPCVAGRCRRERTVLGALTGTAIFGPLKLPVGAGTRENAEKKRQLVTRPIEHKVPDEQKASPKCGGHDFTKLGDGKMTEEYELVPSMVERRLRVRASPSLRPAQTRPIRRA